MNLVTPQASAQRMIDAVWSFVLVAGLFAMIAAVPDLSYADPINAALGKICQAMTGPTARIFASIAVIIVGIGALLGKISWGMAIIVALGIALVFGSASLISYISGQSGGCQ